MSKSNSAPSKFDATKKASDQYSKYTEAKTNYDNLKRNYDNVRKETLKEFKGTNATNASIEALIAQRQNEMVD